MEKKYKKDFLNVLTNGKVVNSQSYMLREHQTDGHSLAVDVFTLNNVDIGQIFVCPFPYSYRYEFSDKDWSFIVQLLKKD